MMIRTARLDLIPGTPALLQAELDDPAALGMLLDAAVPESWPPPLFDADAIQWILDQAADDRAFERWGLHYFLLRGEAGSRAVGAGGYKGPPDGEGAVEIGYSVLPEEQRKGVATEAVYGFVARAFEDPAVTRVVAETFPDLKPSVSVLEKTGFALLGPGSEPGVVRYVLDRLDHGGRRPDARGE